MDRNEACSQALNCTEAGRGHGLDSEHSAPILFKMQGCQMGRGPRGTNKAHKNLAVWVDRKGIRNAMWRRPLLF
jgi:hypothetical protein